MSWQRMRFRCLSDSRMGETICLTCRSSFVATSQCPDDEVLRCAELDVADALSPQDRKTLIDESMPSGSVTVPFCPVPSFFFRRTPLGFPSKDCGRVNPAVASHLETNPGL